MTSIGLTHEERKLRRIAMSNAAQAGERVGAIAARFGVSIATVRNAIRERELA
jgi:transposase